MFKGVKTLNIIEYKALFYVNFRGWFSEEYLFPLDFHRKKERKERVENRGPECLHRTHFCSVVYVLDSKVKRRNWWEVREGARKWSRVAQG